MTTYIQSPAYTGEFLARYRNYFPEVGEKRRGEVEKGARPEEEQGVEEESRDAVCARVARAEQFLEL